MIEVEKLSKRYRVHQRAAGIGAAARSLFRREYTWVDAVKQISFRIEAGERVGFLGPNGAGKTTTLKVLAGLLFPSDGQARVAGHLPFQRKPEFLRAIMLVAGNKQQLLWDLPPSETFELNRVLYGVARADFRQRLDELIDLLDLEPLLKKPTRQLSLGERMKCELAAALIHRPRVLFLDEPTIGLDVTMQARVREFIRSYNQQHGATVVLTSHYMPDVASLCPRVIVIDRGQLVWDGPLGDLARKTRPEKRIKLRLGTPWVPGQFDPQLEALIQGSGLERELRVPQTELRAVVSSLLANAAVVDLTVEDPPLEEVLTQLFGSSPGAPEG